ncbi:MAG TPA: hypothetical protein PLB81_02390, partial [Deltaproteobacteria bacterium]|nr:hypothetical protein [Deltaproteobacteria bacterium]
MNQNAVLKEKANWHPVWTIRKYANDEAFAQDKPFEVSRIDGNLLLNEGIGALLDLLCGLGSPTAFSNANARIGVGDSSTAAAATQTGLQATTNKVYKGMEATYPSRSNQTVTFRAVFGSAEANFSWNEFTVVNGANDDAVNLNRLVSAQGTKASGQTWTVDVA